MGGGRKKGRVGLTGGGYRVVGGGRVDSGSSSSRQPSP